MDIKHIISIGVCENGDIVYLPQKIETRTLLRFFSENGEVKAYNIKDESQDLFAKFFESLQDK